MPNPVPVLSDISVETLMADPYPSFDRIRDLASAVWLDSARINLVTRFEDIVTVERNHAIFASTNPQSLMNTVMGSDGSLGDLLKVPGGGSRHPTTPDTIEKRLHFMKMKMLI